MPTVARVTYMVSFTTDLPLSVVTPEFTTTMRAFERTQQNPLLPRMDTTMVTPMPMIQRPELPDLVRVEDVALPTSQPDESSSASTPEAVTPADRPARRLDVSRPLGHHPRERRHNPDSRPTAA